MARKLTDKQRKFVETYLKNGRNAAGAYRLVYKSKGKPETVANRAHQLLKRGEIAAIVAQAEEKAKVATERSIDRYAVTKERIVEELARLGFANMMDYMRVGADGDPALDFSRLTRDEGAALVEVTVEDFKDGRGEDARDVRRVKFKLADKRAALVDLGRTLALFTDKVEQSGSVEFVVERS